MFSQAGRASPLTFEVGRKGERNILALIASQPYEAFSSSATLVLPASSVRPTIKLYLLTANLAKSLKCYTPHAEVTFVYASGKRDVVSLTPPFSFSSLGGNRGYEAFVPAHFALPFGRLSGVLGSPFSKVAVMDVLVPSPTLPLASIELKTVVTETVFGIMGAALLQ